LNPGDAEVHGILMKIQEREPYAVESFFLATSSEMFEQFRLYHKFLDKSVVKKAIRSTELLAEKVGDYNVPLGIYQYPKFVMGGE
jgi:DNA polymerase III alpha subunit